MCIRPCLIGALLEGDEGHSVMEDIFSRVFHYPASGIIAKKTILWLRDGEVALE